MNNKTESVYVTIELFQGIVDNVCAFRTCKTANKAEKEWLKKYGIKDKISRKCKSQNGTEFHLLECSIEP